MLQIGSRGDAVKALQRQLGITADGIFGPQTQAAVKRFQSSHGLTADGIVGPRTKAALGSGSGSGSGSGGGSATTSKAPTPWETTPAGQAAMFGWSQSVINSDPELKRIFNQATSQQWTPDHFVAAVRGTKWFRTHSDTYRQALVLQKSDPSTYKQRVAQYASQIYTTAVQMGAHGLSTAQLNKMAEEALWFGWSNDQIKQHLGGLVSTYKGAYTGDASTAADRYTQMAAQYGVSVSPTVLNGWVRGTVAGGSHGTTGQTTDASVKQWLIAQATSRYPALAERLKAGETLMDIANPYFQSYAQTLEVNPNSISLKDPLIQAALAGKDAKGQPSTKTVWQFEQDLRNDPRYMKTQQAQDKVMAVGHQVLKDFGFSGA